MRLKKWLRHSGTILALTACMLTTAPIALADQPLRYGGQYYPGEFVLKGKPQLWEEAGIAVDHVLFSSGTENNQALISGRIDVNCGSDSKTVSLFNVLGDKGLIIAVIQKGDRYSTVIPKGSTAKSWRDLKGKTVATRLGSGAEQVLRRYFSREADLDWNDFRWVNLKLESMIASLQAGSIAAFTAWEPTPAIAEAQGFGKVMRTYGDISQVPVSIHTTRAFAKAHPQRLVNFLAAHLAKAELIASDPDKAARFAAQAAKAKGHNVSEDAFKRVFQRINFRLDIDEPALESIRGTARFLKDQGKISSLPEIAWDSSFLEQAKALRKR